MAEVIGVVSGALTFATVVAQVTKSIIQIRDCWGQIQDAPEDLQRLVREVEAFGHILTNIEEDLSDDSVTGVLKNSNHALQSLELCREAASDLKTVSEGLMNEIRPNRGVKRTYASFKVVIKKSNIERYRSRLESAARLLSLSLQCYTRALILVQPELIAARLLSGGHNIGLQTPQNEDEECGTCASSQTSASRSITRRSPKNDYLWRLALPSWLTSKCLEVAGARSRNGWQWNVRSYRIVSYGSEATKCVLGNDAEGLQRLVSTGQLSPFDRFKNGETLAQLAISSYNLEAAVFLLRQGGELNLQYDFDEGGSLLSYIFAYPHGLTSFTIPTLRLLVKYRDEAFDLDDEELEDLAWESLRFFRESASKFHFVLDILLPSFYEAPQSKRNDIAWRYLDRQHYATFFARGWNRHSSGNFFGHRYYLLHRHSSEHWLGLERWDSLKFLRIIFRDITFTACPPEFESYSNFLASYGILNLPNKIARKLGEYQVYRHEQYDQPYYQPMFQFFHEFLVGGLDLNQVGDGGFTLFTSFCHGVFFYGPTTKAMAARNSSLRIWLRDLQNSGVNLRSFGKAQERLFKELTVSVEFRGHFHRLTEHLDGILNPSVQLIGFSHGPSPEDWALWVSEPSDSYAGEFWHMIERRIEMPGGWSSDVHLFL